MSGAVLKWWLCDWLWTGKLRACIHGWIIHWSWIRFLLSINLSKDPTYIINPLNKQQTIDFHLLYNLLCPALSGPYSFAEEVRERKFSSFVFVSVYTFRRNLSNFPFGNNWDVIFRHFTSTCYNAIPQYLKQWQINRGFSITNSLTYISAYCHQVYNRPVIMAVCQAVDLGRFKFGKHLQDHRLLVNWSFLGTHILYASLIKPIKSSAHCDKRTERDPKMWRADGPLI